MIPKEDRKFSRVFHVFNFTNIELRYITYIYAYACVCVCILQKSDSASGSFWLSLGDDIRGTTSARKGWRTIYVTFAWARDGLNSISQHLDM